MLRNGLSPFQTTRGSTSAGMSYGIFQSHGKSFRIFTGGGGQLVPDYPSCINPRDLYSDKPARTLTCRNLAGATGDMQRVRLKDGRRRRLLHREAARLQSFPDWFEFSGNETQRFNQIGNAVPPLLAYQLALALKECYQMEELFTFEDIIQNNIQPNRVLTLF